MFDVAEIEAVRTDEVRTYAPASLDKAEKAAAAFTQEIATQKDKFALSRNYEQAIKLAGEAKSAAKAASSDAVPSVAR